jgi:hypothetical protein
MKVDVTYPEDDWSRVRIHTQFAPTDECEGSMQAGLRKKEAK